MVKIGTFDRATLLSKASKHLGKHVPREASWKAPLLRSFRVSELIKVLTLLGITEDFVSLLDLFELLRVTAFVRVVLTGKFAIGLLNVRL
jgi:hypothetical protein